MCEKCGYISCLCYIIASHLPECKFRSAATGVAIGCSCEWPRDVCPTCDPCTCKELKEKEKRDKMSKTSETSEINPETLIKSAAQLRTLADEISAQATALKLKDWHKKFVWEIVPNNADVVLCLKITINSEQWDTDLSKYGIGSPFCSMLIKTYNLVFMQFETDHIMHLKWFPDCSDEQWSNFFELMMLPELAHLFDNKEFRKILKEKMQHIMRNWKRFHELETRGIEIPF